MCRHTLLEPSVGCVPLSTYCCFSVVCTQDKLEASTDDFADVFEVYYLTSRSFDDALEESVSGEIFLYVATCERVVELNYDNSVKASRKTNWNMYFRVLLSRYTLQASIVLQIRPHL